MCISISISISIHDVLYVCSLMFDGLGSRDDWRKVWKAIRLQSTSINDPELDLDEIGDDDVIDGLLMSKPSGKNLTAVLHLIFLTFVCAPMRKILYTMAL